MLDTKRRVTNLFAAGLLMIAAIFGLLGETTTSTGLFHDSTQTILAAPGGVYSVHYCANCYIKIMNGGKS